MDIPSQFALLRGQAVTAWTMADGQVMTGVLLRENFDTFTVVIPDASRCDVSKEVCRPATHNDVWEASIFLAEQNRSGRVNKFLTDLLGWLLVLLVIAGVLYAWSYFQDRTVTKIVLSFVGIGCALWRTHRRVMGEW